ncbi:MAG: hypothetical protein OSA06_00520 [Acidimicrobiales bacterium]|nr:hypothetical protein [Acidimicrobiales bacterium]
MAEKITPEDLEEELRRTAGGPLKSLDEHRTSLLAGAVMLGVAVVAVAYFLGRRVGRIASTTVEIRRL